MSVNSTPAAVYKDFVLIQLATIIFLLDQLTKFVVRDQLLFRESFPVDGFFRFTHTSVSYTHLTLPTNREV